MGEHISTIVSQADGGSVFGLVLPLVAMMAVMYFLMIRPERKKQGDHQNYLASLKRGDEVVLTSGIIGRIEKVEDRALVVEIADKVKIRVLKIAVSGPSARFLSAGEGEKVPAPAGDKAPDKSSDKLVDKSSDKAADKAEKKAS
jgi:preprotein translocase subunit YajC